ncbi:FtsQ-type POTRA domain-containing protein [Clostridia bacterium]|nr:FtsQ-type POTRA domain-containing protein [Clostridia bacterium]
MGKHKRKLNIWLVLLIFVILVVSWLYLKDYTAKVFKVKEIRLEGIEQIDREDLVILSGIELGEALWKIPAAGIEEKLKSHVLIKDALVVRVVPDAVNIQIWERKASLLMASNGRFVVLDSDGVVMEVVRTLPVEHLAYYAGTSLDEPVYLGQKIVEKETQEVLAFQQKIPESYRYLVYEIEPMLNTWNIYLEDGLKISLGQDEQIEKKLELLVGLLQDSELMERYPEIQYFDLSDPEKPVVKYE